MGKRLMNDSLQGKIFLSLYVTACAALPFINLVALSTFLFIVLGVALLLTGNFTHDFRKHSLLPWLFLLFYLLQITGFIAKPDNASNRFALEQKASLLFIPLLISSLFQYDRSICIKGIKAFVIGNFIACLWCIATAVVGYLHDASAQHFFYHQFASAVKANAIYASLYVVVSMLYLIHFYTTDLWKIPRPLMFGSLFIFIISLMLLSSKMIIVTGSLIIFAFLFFLSNRQVRKFTILSFAVLAGLIMLTRNPVKKRFRDWDLKKTSYVLKKKDFSNYAFDGLDIRILLARLAFESANEKQNWICGSGGPSYHSYLNKKMLSYKMFAGNDVTKDTGYLNYDMHNQYLENFIQYGLIGLLILMLILVTSFFQAIKSKSKMLMSLTMIFFFSFFSESVLETQSGILLFTLIVFYEWKFTKLKTS